MPTMPAPRTIVRRLPSVVLLGCAAAWLAGCANPPRRPYEIPHGTIAAAPGEATHARMAAQNMAAQQSYFIIYAHHWYQGGRHLGPEGQRHVHAIVDQLVHDPVPLPVVIESQPIIVRPDPTKMAPSSDEAYLATVAAARELDLTRRQQIVATLEAAGVADAEERVVIDHVPQGLYGREAPLVSQQIIFGGMFGGRGGRGGVGGGMGGFGGGLGGFGGGGIGGGLGGFGGGGLGGMGGGFGRGGIGAGGIF